MLLSDKVMACIKGAGYYYKMNLIEVRVIIIQRQEVFVEEVRVIEIVIRVISRAIIHLLSDEILM